MGGGEGGFWGAQAGVCGESASHACTQTHTHTLTHTHTTHSLPQVFGPYAAQVLAAHLEQPVAEAMAYLDGQLAALHDSLDPIMAALNVSSGLGHPYGSCTSQVCMYACRSV